MVQPAADRDDMVLENERLRARLHEAEDTLRALSHGEVDAIVVGDDIYRLAAAETVANRFRTDALTQMQDAVIALDVDGHIVYLNPAAERQYGCDASQALGRWMGHLFTPQWLDPADAVQAHQALERHGCWRGRQRHHRHGADTLLVECTQSRLRDETGLVNGTLVVARDLSDKAADEAALRESRARLQFALESARIGDWELDLDSGEWHRSLRHDQCFGYSVPVPQWSVEILLQHVHVDDRADVRRAVDRAARLSEALHYECRVMWPDASEHWIEAHATVLTEAGRSRRLVGIVSDISGRKRAETALREADERKDVFLATLAHELRNPLAPIRNAVRILQLAADPAVHQRALTTLDSQLEQLVHLLDDLMDVSRISQGKMELRRQRLTVDSVLGNAIESTRPLIDRKRHQLVVQLPQRPVLLDGDLTRLTQVFVNLLDNAAKYTPEGGRIELSADVHDGTLTACVLDSGIGIHPAMLPHVFDMFTQVRHRRGATQGGMGIGLALVKRLVEMHGGTVQARSAGEGRGSTIEVRLPAVETTERVEAPPSAEQAPAHRACRVLVAEDNVDSAESMVLLLQLLGHETALAHSGPQAVSCAQAFRPQVVLMDIGLPGCDGYEAARRIRAQPWGRDMMLVALTGWGQASDRDLSRQAGLDHHLVKPVDLSKLEALLRSAQGA